MKTIITQQILNHMMAEGVIPKEDLDFIDDGKIHRFAVQDDCYGKKSGAYFLHSDGFPNWGFMDYHKHNSMIKGKLNTQTLSWAEKQRFSEQYMHHDNPQDRILHEQAQRHQDELYRAKAYGEYQRATHNGAELHPYIRLKKIHTVPHTVKVITHTQQGDTCHQGDLIIPLVNPYNGKFQALERISHNIMRNGKHMKGIYSGTHRTGACFIFPRHQSWNTAPKIILCEGFATGASIHEYTNSKSIVISCFCWSNIINIAKAFRSKSTAQILIAADNDEAGIKGAVQTIEAGYADEYHAPPVTGMDWNDYLTRE